MIDKNLQIWNNYLLVNRIQQIISKSHCDNSIVDISGISTSQGIGIEFPFIYSQCSTKYS